MNNERGHPWGQNKNRMRGGFRGGRGTRGYWRGFKQDFGGPQSQNSNNFRGGNQWNRVKRETPGKRLSEDQIGVTEYITDHEGFGGVIKSRYSDFQVSEINLNGEVAKLTDLTPPQPPPDEIVEEDEDLLFSKYNLEILQMDQWDHINRIATSKESTDETVEIDVTGATKEARTKIHDAVKKAFGNVIVGSTVSVDDKKFVRFQRFRKGVRIDKRVKWIWPAEYVYFIVHKENCDTMEAASRIAEQLRLTLRPSLLGYAGTKDRRAKTSQWFSLRKVDPRRVAAACRQLRDLRVGNYSFGARNLKLGMLRGNRFRICIRNVTAPDEAVGEACGALRERGFLNYYGLQRFGARADRPTHQVGLQLLQGNFRQAIASILEEREGPLQAALQAYKEQGASAALRLCPRAAHVEARLLRALAASPTDLVGALNKLARNTRLLYIHSYQSLVWNSAASRRVASLGLAPAPGDLVPLAPDILQELEEDDSDTDEQNDIEMSENDSNSESQQDLETQTPKQKNRDEEVKPKIPVKILTQEDVDSGKYTIFDVILPLPGYNIDYPPNMKEFYETTLAKDDLKMDMKHKIKSYSMSGAYRHLVVRPRDVEWRCVRYSDPHGDLVASDLDEMLGQHVTAIVDDGKYKALLLTMSLPASCYATMALRELMKVDTASDNQALQNNYHKRRPAEATEEHDEAKKPKSDE